MTMTKTRKPRTRKPNPNLLALLEATRLTAKEETFLTVMRKACAPKF